MNVSDICPLLLSIKHTPAEITSRFTVCLSVATSTPGSLCCSQSDCVIPLLIIFRWLPGCCDLDVVYVLPKLRLKFSRQVVGSFRAASIMGAPPWGRATSSSLESALLTTRVMVRKQPSTLAPSVSHTCFLRALKQQEALTRCLAETS